VTERAGGNNGLLGLLASFGIPLILLAGTFFLFSYALLLGPCTFILLLDLL
jgi:hypothetical protein